MHSAWVLCNNFLFPKSKHGSFNWPTKVYGMNLYA